MHALNIINLKIHQPINYIKSCEYESWLDCFLFNLNLLVYK